MVDEDEEILYFPPFRLCMVKEYNGHRRIMRYDAKISKTLGTINCRNWIFAHLCLVWCIKAREKKGNKKIESERVREKETHNLQKQDKTKQLIEVKHKIHAHKNNGKFYHSIDLYYVYVCVRLMILCMWKRERGNSTFRFDLKIPLFPNRNAQNLVSQSNKQP